MQESSAGGPSPEAASIQEQGAIRSLALDVQDVVSIYKKQRAEGRSGTEIPFAFVASDIDQLKGLGVLDKYKPALVKIGADPIIRFPLLSQIDQAGQDYDQLIDKSPALTNIKTLLELGEALGLDQSAGNPDFEAAAKLFNDFKDKYLNAGKPQQQSTPLEEQLPTPQAEDTELSEPPIVRRTTRRARPRSSQPPADSSADSTEEPTSETVSPTPPGANELIENATFDQVLAELRSIDSTDEKIQKYLELLSSLDNSPVADILADKFKHLKDTLSRGLTPATLAELTELSEYATAKLEELGNLNPASHGEEIKNVRNAVYAVLTNLPEEQALTTPIATEIAKTRVPDKTSGQDLIKLVNKFLKDSGADAQRNVEAIPEVLARYIKETVKFQLGAGFDGTPEVKIVKDPQGRNVLDISGRIGTFLGKGGEANFHLTIANKPGGGIEVVDRDIQATGKVKEKIDSGENKIEAINEILMDQTNQRIDPEWETANFHIADDVIVFEFRRKEAPV